MYNIQDIRDTILALLVPEKIKYHIPVAKLDQLYQEIDGERIPWKALGYPSLVDFLETIEPLDIYRENGSHYLNFHGTDKTAHISELVSHQKSNKNNKKPSNRKHIPSRYFNNNRPIKSYENDRPLDVDTCKNATFFDDPAFDYEDYKDNNSINLNKSSTSNRSLKIRKIIETSNNIHKENNSTKNKSDDVNINNYINQWNNVNKINIRGVDNNNNNEEGDKYYFDISTKTREQLIKLIKKRPEGIRCAKLPDIYYKEYNEVLDWEDYSCDSLTQFACNLPEIFHLVQPNSHGDFILYDVSKPRPDSISDDSQDEEQSLNNSPRRNNDIPLNLLPVSRQLKNSFLSPDVVKLGEYVKPFDTSDPQYQRLINGCWELIDVVEIFSPSFFWIRLNKSHITQTPSAFDDMMNELHNFYEENKTEYVIHIEFAVGLNVACKFYDLWHRGIIKEIMVVPEKKAKVFFYDYGTISEYSFSDLYLLKREFAQLPVQAVPCGLYRVKPIGNSWSTDDCRYFVKKVHGKTLFGLAYSCNSENNFLLLNLAETTGEEDTHFNDDLVNQKIAEHGSVRIRPENYQMPRAIIPLKKIVDLDNNNTNNNNNNNNNSCLVPKNNLSIIKNNSNNNNNITNIVDKIHNKVFEKFLLVPQMCGKDRKALIVKEIVREVVLHVMNECKINTVEKNNHDDSTSIDISSLHFDDDHKNNTVVDQKLININHNVLKVEEKKSGIVLPDLCDVNNNNNNKINERKILQQKSADNCDKKKKILSSVLKQDEVNDEGVGSTDSSEIVKLMKNNDEINSSLSNSIDNINKQKVEKSESIQNNDNINKQKVNKSELIQNNVDDENTSSFGPTSVSDIIMPFDNNEGDYPQDFPSVSIVPSQSKSLQDVFSGNILKTSLLCDSSLSDNKNPSTSGEQDNDHSQESLTSSFASDLIDWKFFGVTPDFIQNKQKINKNSSNNIRRNFDKYDRKNYQRYQNNYSRNNQRDNYYSRRNNENFENKNYQNVDRRNYNFERNNYNNKNYRSNFKYGRHPKIILSNLTNIQEKNIQTIPKVIHQREKFYNLFKNNEDDKIHNYKCLLVNDNEDDTYKINLKNKLNNILENHLEYKIIKIDISNDDIDENSSLTTSNDDKKMVKIVSPVVSNNKPINIISSLKKMFNASAKQRDTLSQVNLDSDDLTSANKSQTFNSSSDDTDRSVDKNSDDKIIVKEYVCQKNESIDSDDLISENKSQIFNSSCDDIETFNSNKITDLSLEKINNEKQSQDNSKDIDGDSMKKIKTDIYKSTIKIDQIKIKSSADDNDDDDDHDHDHETSEDVSPKSSKSDASNSSSLETNLLSDCNNNNDNDNLNITTTETKNNLEITKHLPNNSIPVFNDIDLPSDDSEWEALTIDLNDFSLYTEHWDHEKTYESDTEKEDDNIKNKLQHVDLPEGFHSYTDYINYLNETIKKLRCDREIDDELKEKNVILISTNQELQNELKIMKENNKILDMKNKEINEERMSLEASLKNSKNENAKLKLIIENLKNDSLKQCATCCRTISRATSYLSDINSIKNNSYDDYSNKSICTSVYDDTIILDDFYNQSSADTILDDDLKSDIENYYNRANLENSIKNSTNKHIEVLKELKNSALTASNNNQQFIQTIHNNSSNKQLKVYKKMENTFYSINNSQQLLETNPFKWDILKNKKNPPPLPPPRKSKK